MRQRLVALVARWRSLTPRQAATLAGAGLPGLAAAVAALAGRPAVALAAVAMVSVLVFVAVVQVRRRMNQELEAVTRQTARLLDVAQERAEAIQRRVLAAIEHDRLAADERQRDLLQLVEQTVQGAQRRPFEDVEALLQLYRGFEPRAPMPPSDRGWALDPAGLLMLRHLVEERQPRLVLELGSGTSSVWLGYTLEKSGGRLVSLEHEPEYVDRTRSLLAMHGLEHVAEVRLAPLTPLDLDGEKFDWYDPGVLADIADVDLVLVDGPPGRTGPAARYPAFPVLEPRLAPSAVIVVDDVQRPAEREIVDRWLSTCDGLRREPEVFRRQAILLYVRERGATNDR